MNLHLSHSWGGGLGRWVQEFADADGLSDNLVLESFGTIECYGIGFRLVEPRTGAVLRRWILQHPIADVSPSNPEYAALLGDLCEELRVDHIYLSSLVGQSLDVFRIGVPITKVYHDYFSYCPALYLVRDGICTSCNESDLLQCRARPEAHRPKSSPRYYQRYRDAFFEAVAGADVRHVSPSASLPRNLERLDSRFGEIDFTILEHGAIYSRRDCFGGAEEGRRLRVGLLGRLTWPKGTRLLEARGAHLRAIADLYLVGAGQGGKAIAERWSLPFVPAYSPATLPTLLAELGLDLLLYLSEVPESFSYTLSEAWCFGLPPVARRIGALADRIDDGEDGFLIGLEPEAPERCLLELDRDRDRLRRVAETIRRKPIRTVDEAIRDYYRLRPGLLPRINRRLTAALRRVPRLRSPGP